MFSAMLGWEGVDLRFGYEIVDFDDNVRFCEALRQGP